MRNPMPVLRRTMPPRHNPTRGQLVPMRTMPEPEPVVWDPRPQDQFAKPPTILDHLLNSWKRRMHLRIDGRAARTALPTLRIITEQAKLATEYQAALNSLSTTQVEREVRLAELELRRLELAGQKRQHQRLEGLRLRKEQLALQLDIAVLTQQIHEQRQAPATKLTAQQQKAVKKAEIEEQLQQLRAEAIRAVRQADDEPEKRRLQNMYNGRRDRLMEQLEKYL